MGRGVVAFVLELIDCIERIGYDEEVPVSAHIGRQRHAGIDGVGTADGDGAIMRDVRHQPVIGVSQDQIAAQHHPVLPRGHRRCGSRVAAIASRPTHGNALRHRGVAWSGEAFHEQIGERSGGHIDRAAGSREVGRGIGVFIDLISDVAEDEYGVGAR